MKQMIVLFLVIGLVLLIGGCTYVQVQVRDMSLQCRGNHG